MGDDSEIDELFANEVEVGPAVASRPRLVPVLGALVVLGLLVGVLVSVVVSGLSAIGASGLRPGAVVCGGDAVCENLSLDQVRSLTGIDLPDKTEVVDSHYAETDNRITVTAQLVLPDGTGNPFEGTNYGEISTPSIEWPVDDLAEVTYYAAGNEADDLTAEAAYGINDRIRGTVFVQVTRTTK